MRSQKLHKPLSYRGLCASMCWYEEVFWCPWPERHYWIGSGPYRVPPLPCVPLNSKAYFLNCPTEICGSL